MRVPLSCLQEKVRTFSRGFFLFLLGSYFCGCTLNKGLVLSETEESLKKNIRGNCDWTFGKPNTVEFQSYEENPVGIKVSKHLPTKQEIKIHRSLPVTLSKAFHTLAERVKEDQLFEWGAEKGLMWQLPDDHPAQNRQFCVNATIKLTNGNIESLYEAYKSDYRVFYVIYLEKAYIHAIGSVGIGCGFFQGIEGCETRWKHGEIWWNRCTNKLRKLNLSWETLWLEEEEASDAQLQGINSCKVYKLIPQRHEEVFVVDALWDFNFHHFLIDSIARLARHIDFLRENPHVKIHIRAFDLLDETRNRTEQFKVVAARMRQSIFSLLGIDMSRVIYGPVLADKVHVPRSLRCSFALSNPLEVRLTGKVMADAARKQLGIAKSDFNKLKKSPKKRYSMLQVWGWREWSNSTLEIVKKAFERKFPEHNVITLNSNTINTAEYCLACEIMEFVKADILVGVHGAGLTNMIYMSGRSLVVELATQYNPAVMPVCGYYGSLAAVSGHHHYLYAYNRKDEPPIESDKLASEVRNYYIELKNL